MVSIQALNFSLCQSYFYLKWENSFYDETGNYVFTVPNNYIPILPSKYTYCNIQNDNDICSPELYRTNLSNYPVISTVDSIIVIKNKSDDKFALLNINDQIVKTFESNIFYASYVSCQYILGVRPTITTEYFDEHVYFNTNGKLVLQNNYRNATPFVDGYAIVQNFDYSWDIIDKNGAVISEISKKFSDPIVEVYPFLNGSAQLITLNSKYRIRNSEFYNLKIVPCDNTMDFVVPRNSFDLIKESEKFNIDTLGNIKKLDANQLVDSYRFDISNYGKIKTSKSNQVLWNIVRSNKISGLKIDSTNFENHNYYKLYKIGNEDISSFRKYILDSQGNIVKNKFEFFEEIIKLRPNYVLGITNSTTYYFDFKYKEYIEIKSTLTEIDKNYQQFSIDYLYSLEFDKIGNNLLILKEGEIIDILQIENKRATSILNSKIKKSIKTRIKNSERLSCNYYELINFKIGGDIEIECDTIDFEKIRLLKSFRKLVLYNVKFIKNWNLLLDNRSNLDSLLIYGDYNISNFNQFKFENIKFSIFVNDKFINEKYVNLDLNFPDIEFRKYIIEKFPRCANRDGSIDINSPYIRSCDTIVINNYNIQDITGINYFENLKYLKIITKVKNVPKFPTSLESLIIQNNLINLDEWNFPPELTYLHLNKVTFFKNNNIEIIVNLPSKIKSLILEDTNLGGINKFPPDIEYLSLSHFNSLNNLPSKLKSLKLSEIKNYNLSKLPDSLTTLDGYKIEQIINLLPKNLENLTLSKTNYLLPPLPENLKSLNIYDISAIYSPFPPKLETLKIYNGKIKALPRLPENLKILQLFNLENFIEINYLPNGLENLYIFHSKIKIPKELPSGMKKFRVIGPINEEIPIINSDLEYFDYSYSHPPDSVLTFSHKVDTIICENCHLKYVNILKANPKYLDLNYNTNLSELELTPNLTYLDLSDCNFQNLKYIPSQLESLKISNNPLQEFSYFNEKLIYFDGRRCGLTSLPRLPDSLKELTVSENELSQIDYLPKNLKKLDLSRNNLKTLDISNLTKLETAKLTDNELEYISDLPENLLSIDLSNNYLVQFPNIPNNLNVLNLFNNAMTNLTLPNFRDNNLTLNLKCNKIKNLKSFKDKKYLKIDIEELEFPSNYTNQIDNDSHIFHVESANYYNYIDVSGMKYNSTFKIIDSRGKNVQAGKIFKSYILVPNLRVGNYKFVINDKYYKLSYN